MSRYVSADLVAWVRAQAAGRCEYCRAPQSATGQMFHIDHVVPRTARGRTVAENLSVACSHCNLAKARRTRAVDPRSGQLVRFFNPRSDRWDAHFRWSGDGFEICGRTAIGRATTMALNMNDALMRSARVCWRLADLLR